MPNFSHELWNRITPSKLKKGAMKVIHSHGCRKIITIHRVKCDCHLPNELQK
jgi:hypothetical protein